MNKRNKIIIYIFVALIILNIILWGMVGYSNLSYKSYKPKSYIYQNIDLQEIEQTLTKQSAKELIKRLYNTPHFYKEKELKQAGRSIIFIRKVEINKNLSLNDYIITYAHELTHIKYVTVNETFVSYKAFKTLYESGNEELRYHSMVYASEVLSGIWAGTDYDCGYYILKYLAR